MSTIEIRTGALLLGLALLGSACQLDTRVPEPAPETQVAVAELRGGGASKGGGGKTKVVCPMEGQQAVPEECNAFDDDCDGVMDEGVCNDPCDEAW